MFGTLPQTKKLTISFFFLLFPLCVTKTKTKQNKQTNKIDPFFFPFCLWLLGLVCLFVFWSFVSREVWKHLQHSRLTGGTTEPFCFYFVCIRFLIISLYLLISSIIINAIGINKSRASAWADERRPLCNAPSRHACSLLIGENFWKKFAFFFS
jgi:uncharacterized membrane protein